MTNAKGYNGFANYHTWAVALWIDNDQGLQETALEMAQAAIDNPRPNDFLPGMDTTAYRLSKTLEDWIEDMAPDLGASMFADLLNAAMSEVDWREIAEHYIADAKENAAYEEDQS